MRGMKVPALDDHLEHLLRGDAGNHNNGAGRDDGMVPSTDFWNMLQVESGLQLSAKDMQMLKAVECSKVVLPIVGEHIVWAPFVKNITAHLRTVYTRQKFDETSAWANVPYVMDKKPGKDTAAAAPKGENGHGGKDGKQKKDAKRTWWYNKMSGKCQWDPPPHIAKRIKEAEKQAELEKQEELAADTAAGRTSPLSTALVQHQ
jgi:hypothetical protein